MSRTGRSARVVLTVNARVSDSKLHAGGGEDNRRTDFQALAAALRAEIVDWDVADAQWFSRLCHRRMGFGPVAAVLVFLRRNRYDVIWCFSEIEGLILALLFKVFRIHRILFFVGIETLSPKSMVLLRRLKVWTHFTAVLPTSSYQAKELRRMISIPDHKVVVLPYQVDCQYFSRSSSGNCSNTTPYIVAAGLESRDYSILIDAVTDLEVEVRIAAASLWSGRHQSQVIEAIPKNVTFGVYSYAELRELYDKASAAVVPLRESPYQHGITALQEAMAMGLPVVVTRTVGQSDVVIDRRSVLRSNVSLGTQGGFAELLAPQRMDLQKSNGFYVGVGDVDSLKRTIRYLMSDRAIAMELGKQAQRFARDVLSLELFVERAVRLVETAWERGRVCQMVVAVCSEHGKLSGRLDAQECASSAKPRLGEVSVK